MSVRQYTDAERIAAMERNWKLMRRMLWMACAKFGDLDWDAELHPLDVLEKHLLDHLEQNPDGVRAALGRPPLTEAEIDALEEQYERMMEADG